ncbi:hypothetical protein GGR56DRAFT_490425 [Xylariaceae sp. FL0804]|nr:hypothetical protein GGR56DRAFT_490425 [Xylariaceae sp. FL0804]
MPPKGGSTFDATSGQVFLHWDEQPVEVPKVSWDFQPCQPCFDECPLVHGSTKPYRGRVRGARPLVDMGVAVVAKNLDRLEETGHLAHVPIPLIKRIWEEILSHRHPSLHEWKLCSRYLFGEDLQADIMRHTGEIVVPEAPLSHYTKPITSASFAFIAHLQLMAGAIFNTHELLSLTQLRNLGVLEIIQPQEDEWKEKFPRVTDSVIREWASQREPFPVLRILKVWGNDFTTPKSVRYLSSFPALKVYDVAGREDDWAETGSGNPAKTGRELGWQFNRITLSHLRTLKFIDHNLRKRFTKDPLWPAVGFKAPQPLNYTGRTAFVRTFPADRNFWDLLPVWKAACPLWSAGWRPRKMEDWRPGLWGFFRFCEVGTSTHDGDLLRQGVSLFNQTEAFDGLSLPPLPYITLCLGSAEHPYKTHDLSHLMAYLAASRKLPSSFEKRQRQEWEDKERITDCDFEEQGVYSRLPSPPGSEHPATTTASTGVHHDLAQPRSHPAKQGHYPAESSAQAAGKRRATDETSVPGTTGSKQPKKSRSGIADIMASFSS